MKITQASRGNHLTFFEATDDEVAALLRWLQFCRERGQQERDASASDLWKNWLGDTSVGFSGSNRLLLYGGHNAARSYFVDHAKKPETLGRWLKRGLSILKGRSGEPSPGSLVESYRRCYPGVVIDPGELAWGADLIYQYLYSHETFELVDRNSKPLDPAALGGILEIGAGAGMNTALLLRRQGDRKAASVICDLPQTIIAGYLFLRSLLPGVPVRLPDEFDPASPMRPGVIQYIVPDQIEMLPGACIDLAVNTASFQEMDLPTVNGYLAQSARVLRGGGLLVSRNQRRSRYIEGNSLDRWDTGGFSAKIVEAEAVFTQSMNPFGSVLVALRK